MMIKPKVNLSDEGNVAGITHRFCESCLFQWSQDSHAMLAREKDMLDDVTCSTPKNQHKLTQLHEKITKPDRIKPNLYLL